MNLLSGRAIESPQNAMEITRPASLDSFTQTLAQFFRPLWAKKKSFEQSAQVESSSAHNDRQVSALLNLIEHLPCLARVFARCNVAGRRDAINQMMRRTHSFRCTRLGGADVKLAIHRDRIAVHDLAVEALRK